MLFYAHSFAFACGIVYILQVIIFVAFFFHFLILVIPAMCEGSLNVFCISFYKKKILSMPKPSDEMGDECFVLFFIR